MKILLVHGRGQAPKTPDQVRTEWLDSLRSGFAAVGVRAPDELDVAVPYYGRVLDELTRNEPPADEILSKGLGTSDEYAEFLAEILTEMADNHPDITEAAVRREFPDDQIGAKGPRNWRWLHAVLRFVDRHWAAPAEYTIEQHLRDVFLYLNRRVVAQRVEEIVTAELTAHPTVVVGHSLGSIVAYNILKRLQPDPDTLRFVTVGSPLGLRAVSSRLGGRLQNVSPAGWLNAYDTRDIVSLYGLDGDHFPVAPAITNFDKVRNDTPDRHGIKGYLRDPDVARWIAAEGGAAASR